MVTVMGGCRTDGLAFFPLNIASRQIGLGTDLSFRVRFGYICNRHKKFGGACERYGRKLGRRA